METRLSASGLQPEQAAGASAHTKSGMMAHNRRLRELWPLDRLNACAPIAKFSFEEVPAKMMFNYLEQHWDHEEGILPLRYDGVQKHVLKGFTSYSKTLAPHLPKLQQQSTLLIEAGRSVDKCRWFLPGFSSMHQQVMQHASCWCAAF